LLGDEPFCYDQLATSIYALGVGCSTDPFNEDELNFMISKDDAFKVLPTFTTVIWTTLGPVESYTLCPGIPEFDPLLLLHVDQRMEVFWTLPPAMEGRVVARIVDVQDKKSAALIIYERNFFANDGTLIAKNTGKVFIRGIGGFGDPGIIKDPPIPSVPTRTPDMTHTETTGLNLPVIFQLAGDINPHNIYSDKAAVGGFERPIMHGLCTMGFSARAILQSVLNYDVSKFRSFKVRLTLHVYPGETLVTDLWKEGNQVFVSVKTAERGLQVLYGVAEISEEPLLRFG
jgi:acyl dehydratase